MPSDEEETTTNEEGEEESSDGSDAEESTSDTSSETTESTEQTTMAQNDPAKNKRMAEITMAEPWRQTFQFELTLPGVYPGMHTNQFIWLDVSDGFYEDFYGEISDGLGMSRFNRYVEFVPGRFYVEELEWSYTISDGVVTKLTLNPYASPYSDYIKAKLEAETALDNAVSDTNSYGGGSTVSSGSLSDANGDDCGDDLAGWTPREFSDSAFEENANKIIGNKEANYATETSDMTAEEAIKSINHDYTYYRNNKTCPRDLWENYPNIICNCADWARLVKCICDVHGQKCAIYHGSQHYFNAVKIGDSWETVDLCTNSKTNTWDGHPRNSAGWN